MLDLGSLQNELDECERRKKKTCGLLDKKGIRARLRENLEAEVRGLEAAIRNLRAQLQEMPSQGR